MAVGNIFIASLNKMCISSRGKVYPFGQHRVQLLQEVLISGRASETGEGHIQCLRGNIFSGPCAQIGSQAGLDSRITIIEIQVDQLLFDLLAEGVDFLRRH